MTFILFFKRIINVHLFVKVVIVSLLLFFNQHVFASFFLHWCKRKHMLQPFPVSNQTQAYLSSKLINTHKPSIWGIHLPPAHRHPHLRSFSLVCTIVRWSWCVKLIWALPPSRLRLMRLDEVRSNFGAGRSMRELAKRVWAWVRPL